MGFLQKLIDWKKNHIEDPEDYEPEEWNEIVYARDDLKINDKAEREEYVRSCLDQIADATKEVENLQFEYNLVTSYLKDMEEIEALPELERRGLNAAATKLDEVEEQKTVFQKKTGRMSDAQFHQMERLADEVQEGYEKLDEAEAYQDLIKQDLRRLDGERQAYAFRRKELKRIIEDMKGLAIITVIAFVLCILLLLVLQFGFGMNTKTGYLVTTGIAAAAMTYVFIRHGDSVSELKRVENGINRLILLQNRVKIRYVNNTNLLDYLYMKYEVTSADELGDMWEKYQEEKEERNNFRQAERELDLCQKEFLHILRRFQVKDPEIWLHQTQALYDKKEMVEIRHNLIIRRQSLRRRMDYNKEVIAAKAQNEIKDLVEKYPKYAKEIMGIVGQYEKTYH